MADEKQKKSISSLWTEFKAFINRGNVVDMAIGVIMGSAFGAIVTAFTNILLSICTWTVPGGLKGLYTVLPAANQAQKGLANIGQKFNLSQLNAMVSQHALNNGVSGITAESDTFLQWKGDLLNNYTLKGSEYVYNQSSVIDWGTFINAIIAFIIIALTLFVILKIYTSLRNRRLAFESGLKAKINGQNTPTSDKK